MEATEAIKTIQLLANGIDPVTGEIFPDSSPYNHPKIIRALFRSLKALERVKEKRERSLPANAGKAWNSEEDRLLMEGFDAGVLVKQLATKHGRTEGAIAARLVRLGKISERAEVYTRT